MYVVFIEDDECHKELLFCTDVLQTATSFIENFQKRINELHKWYYAESPKGLDPYFNPKHDKIIEDWKYESGFNAKVQELVDQMNISVEISYDRFVDTFIRSHDSLHYEEVKKL